MTCNPSELWLCVDPMRDERHKAQAFDLRANCRGSGSAILFFPASIHHPFCVDSRRPTNVAVSPIGAACLDIVN